MIEGVDRARVYDLGKVWSKPAPLKDARVRHPNAAEFADFLTHCAGVDYTY
jgi:hypothetical protein